MASDETERELMRWRDEALEARRVLSGSIPLDRMDTLIMEYAERYAARFPDLLAEVARLRAREAALLAREEQMRGVVEIMAKGPMSWNPEYGDICACCDRAWIDGDPDDDQPGAIQHTSDCAVVLARAMLASE